MTQQIDRQAVIERVRQRLIDGTLSQEEAAKVLQSLPAEAQPVAPQPVTPTAPQPQENMGWLEGSIKGALQAPKEFVKGVAGGYETVATLGTAALAEPVSGLVGLASMPFVGAERAGGVVRSVQEGMMYQPRTESGQQILGAAGAALAPVGKAFDVAEQATGDVGYAIGGPALGAVSAAIPAAVTEILGLGIAKKAKKAALVDEVRRTGADNVLTPEVREALRKQDFTDADIDEIASIDADQLERLQRFQEAGVQPTRGDILQTTEARRAEQQLMETATGEAPARMRGLMVEKSQDLESHLRSFVDRNIDNDALGASIKDALTDRKRMTKDQAKAAYAALADTTEGMDTPVLLDDYRAFPEMPNDLDLSNIKAEFPAQFGNMEKTLARFGLSDDATALAALQREGLDITPLSVGNFESLQQSLNRISAAEQTGSMSRVVQPIRRAIDEQIGIATEAMAKSSNPDVVQLAKEARQNWHAFKTEFDPKSLVEQMIADKPRSTIPVVENSQVYSKIAANGTPIEQLDRVYQSLSNEGAKGQRAIANLQGALITDLLDSSFTGATNKIDGTPVMSTAAMVRRYEQLEPKIKLLYQDNPAAMSQLENAIQVARDVTPGRLEIVKGSGNVILDALNTMGLYQVVNRIPGGGLLLEGMQELSSRSQNRAAFEAAMKARPAYRRTAVTMATDFPMLGNVLGIGYLYGLEEDEDGDN